MTEAEIIARIWRREGLTDAQLAERAARNIEAAQAEIRECTGALNRLLCRKFH
jgi:hypothetical protein